MYTQWIFWLNPLWFSYWNQGSLRHGHPSRHPSGVVQQWQEQGAGAGQQGCWWDKSPGRGLRLDGAQVFWPITFFWQQRSIITSRHAIGAARKDGGLDPWVRLGKHSANLDTANYASIFFHHNVGFDLFQTRWSSNALQSSRGLRCGSGKNAAMNCIRTKKNKR